jgi:hypothetical protein
MLRFGEMNTNDLLLDLIKVKLRNVVMATRLTGAMLLKFDGIIRNSKTFKHASVYNWTWLIRAPAGKAVLVGSLRPYDTQREKAIRYADMATLYFWKYRIRGAASDVPPEDEFNLSLAQAKADLQNEPELSTILRQTEAYLVQLGRLPAPVELAARKAGDSAKLAANLSRYKQIEEKLEVIARGVAAILTVLKDK